MSIYNLTARDVPIPDGIKWTWPAVDLFDALLEAFETEHGSVPCMDFAHVEDLIGQVIEDNAE